MIETRLSQNLKRTAPRPFVVVMAKFDSVKDVRLPTPALLIWRKIQISAEQACTMEKSQWRDMSMSEDGNPVCTYSGANSCKEVRVCDYEYWIKWARLLSPMHHENARKTSSSSTGLPLKSKSVKTWETEVWRWSLLYNEKPIVDVSTQLTTRCSKQGWIKISKRTAPRSFIVVTAKYDSVKEV